MPLFQDPDPEVGKSQALRVLDVTVLAPAMIVVGLMVHRGRRIPRWVGVLSILGGIGTAYYNARNYVRLR